MNLENDLTSYESAQMYEAETKYEIERRKTELALAKERRKADRFDFLTDEDFMIGAVIVLVIAIIFGSITYGLTRPTSPADVEKERLKNEQRQSLIDKCYDAGGIWDNRNSGNCKVDD